VNPSSPAGSGARRVLGTGCSRGRAALWCRGPSRAPAGQRGELPAGRAPSGSTRQGRPPSSPPRHRARGLIPARDHSGFHHFFPCSQMQPKSFYWRSGSFSGYETQLSLLR